MASIARLVVSLGASTAQFERDLKKAGGISKREMARMERQAKRLNDKWNRNFRIAGLAVAGGLAVATKAAIDFEKAMGEVATLGAGNIDKLGDSVKKMSVEFGQAPVEQAKALYQIISAGASTASEQIELLTASNKLAVGGITDVATAADGLTSVYNAYAAQGLTAIDISDTLFTTMKEGKTTIGELNQSIGNVATIASQVGVKFTEVGAAIGTLTKSGIDTSRAIDGLRGVLSAVLKQSPAAVQAAKDMGVEFNIAAIESMGFAEWLQSIATNGKVTSEGLAKMFGRVEALSTVMSIGAENMAEFNSQLAAQAERAGATGKAVAIMMETTAQKAARARAAIQVLGIELGEKFLATIANTSDMLVKHIDTIAIAVESLGALIIARVGVAVAASFAAAAASAGAFATAMAIVGGPIGLATAAVALLIINLERLQEMQNWVGNFVRTLSVMFIKLGGIIATLAIQFGAMIDIVISSIQSVIAPLNVLIATLAEVGAKLSAGDFLGAKAAFEGFFETIDKEIKKGRDKFEQAWKNFKFAPEAFDAALARSESMMKKWAKQADQSADEVKDLGKAAKTTVKPVKDLGVVAETTAAQISLITEGSETAVGSVQDLADWVEQLRNQLDPLGAAMRQTRNDIIDLDDALERNLVTADEYDRMLSMILEGENSWRDSIKATTKEVGFMSTAIDEGIRILTRAFSDMWQTLLDGSSDVFSDIASGFKSLMANLIHQASTQIIVDVVAQGVQTGQWDFGKLGEGLATFASVIGGAALGGGGEFATLGSGAGALFGKAAFSSLFPTLFQSLGSFAGPIGIAIGAVIGGFLGGLFDKDRPAVLQVSSFDTTGLSKSDDDALISTLFGDTFLRSRRIDSAAIGEIGQAIEDFDNAFSFLDPAQINSITEALAGWGQQMEGEAINIEQLLTSRFRTILSTFADDIQAFVNQGEDLAAQMDRLQVSFAAQDILDAAPDLFSGRTLTEFLSVVSGFAEGMGSITDGFNEVVRLVNIVGSVLTSLKDFAGSDLTADYNALLAGDVSLTEALAGMNAGLMDAVANFDGSIESLQQIGAIAMTIREGELKLLAQIDGVMQGLNASLDKLKADILAVGQPAATGEEIFNSAAALINTVAAARTPEEVAQIGQQFEALIRSLSEADQLSNQSELARMIEVFRGAANDTLAAQRQEVLDNAEQTRNMLDGFLTRIGDTLDIIAGSNQAAADSLAIIAGENTGFNEGSGAVDDALFEKGEGRKERDRGIEKAIRQGFKGVNMNVILPGGGLVNE